MSKAAFDKIAAGLEDAIAFADGDAGRGRVAAQIDEKKVGAVTKKPRTEFASSSRLSAATVQDWEQNCRQSEARSRD